MTFTNLNLPGLLARARATNEQSYWLAPLGYEP